MLTTILRINTVNTCPFPSTAIYMYIHVCQYILCLVSHVVRRLHRKEIGGELGSCLRTSPRRYIAWFTLHTYMYILHMHDEELSRIYRIVCKQNLNVSAEASMCIVVTISVSGCYHNSPLLCFRFPSIVN